jgi:erythromycin esterase
MKTPVLALLCLAASAANDPATVRSQLSKLYARLDAALVERPDDALLVALPDAMVQHGTERIRFATTIAQIKQALQNGAAVKQRTTIDSLQLAGTTVRVTRHSEVSVTIGGQTRRGVERAEDTWTHTPDGWRLQLSIALGSNETAPQSSAPTDAAVAEIDRHAHSRDDLRAIAEAIGDARVVALGEATHGTQESSAFNASIVEHLAANKGFTVLAVEDNWADAFAIDHYIQTGTGTPEAALARLKGWPLQTPEMLALIRTLRAINTQSAGRMTFAGFDMTWPETALARVKEFVRQTAPAHLATIEKHYAEVNALGPRRPDPGPDARPAAAAARKVADLLDALRDELINASNAHLWHHARQAAEIVYQATAFRIEGQSPGFRDEMMARNVRWLLEQEHPGKKIILWAHNGHISAHCDAFFKPMGAWLREKLGNQYYAIGYSVAGGEVRAAGAKGLAAVHTMPAAPQDSGDAVLARASKPIFFLDMRCLPDGPAKVWLTEPHKFYSVGARWNETVPDANTAVFPMSKSFDGLIFIREGHASTPVP